MGLALISPPPLVSDPLVLEAPPAKSALLRALFAGALAGGAEINGLSAHPLPEDVLHFCVALERLGVAIQRDGDVLWLEGRPRAEGSEVLELNAGEGAAPARFLAALAASLARPIRIAGEGSLLRRPMVPLIEALEALGAEVRGGPFLPFTVKGPLRGGAEVTVDARTSSQFTSALLLVGGSLAGGLRIHTEEARVSTGYVTLTIEMLARFGLLVQETATGFDIPPGQRLSPAKVTIERDWSAASVLLAATAYLDRPVIVPGLDLNSSQPDQRFSLLAGGLGLQLRQVEGAVRAEGHPRTPIEIFAGGCPDAVPALAALGALVPGAVRLHGAPHLRFKESNRIEALTGLFQAVGVPATPLPDGLSIRGPLLRDPDASPVRVTSRGDHRMAMTAALLGLYRPVLIDDVRCVAKSFPGFFERWPGTVKRQSP